MPDLSTKLSTNQVGESERKWRCFGLVTSEKAAEMRAYLARSWPTPTLSAFFEPLWFNNLRRKEGSFGVK